MCQSVIMERAAPCQVLPSQTAATVNFHRPAFEVYLFPGSIVGHPQRSEELKLLRDFVMRVDHRNQSRVLIMALQ